MKRGILRLCILCAALIALQQGIEGMARRYPLSVDLSQGHITQLDEGTRQVLDGLNQPVEIYLLYRGSTQQEQRVRLNQLAGQYRLNSANIAVGELDPIAQPGLVRSLTGRDEPVAEGTVVVKNARTGAAKAIGPEEMYTYRAASGGYTPYAFNAQARITGAILYVTQERMPNVYFLAGHEELGLSYCAALKAQLEAQNYAVAQWSVGQGDLRPEDTLVVAAPTLDLTQSEYEALAGWLAAGGRMLYATDPSVDMDGLRNFARLLDGYGLAFEKGYVVEGERELSRYLNSRQSIVPLVDAAAQACKGLSAARLVLPQCGAVKMGGATFGLNQQALLTTSASAFLKSPTSQTDLYTREAGDPAGPFVLAMSALKADTGTRVVALASIYTLADTSYLSATNNLNFTVSAVNWLVNQTAYASVAPKVLGDSALSVGDARTYWALAALVVAGMPLMVLMAGAIAWQRRRHR